MCIVPSDGCNSLEEEYCRKICRVAVLGRVREGVVLENNFREKLKGGSRAEKRRISGLEL